MHLISADAGVYYTLHQITANISIDQAKELQDEVFRYRGHSYRIMAVRHDYFNTVHCTMTSEKPAYELFDDGSLMTIGAQVTAKEMAEMRKQMAEYLKNIEKINRMHYDGTLEQIEDMLYTNATKYGISWWEATLQGAV